MIAMLLAVSSILPVEYETRHRVDMIEVNHVCEDREGWPDPKVRLEQLILWRLNERGRYEVVDWCMLRGMSGIGRRLRGRWMVRFRSRGGCRRHRCVTAPAYRETWTEYDPEVEDHANVKPEKREAL